MKRILTLLLVIFIINSCKKDLDLKKFNNYALQPEMGFPLGVINMEMKDLIKEDSNIVYGTDGLIRFVLREDSIASFPVDSFVKIPPIAPIQIKNALGMIDIGNISMSQSRTLTKMTESFGAATKAALEAADGQNTIFPAINDQNSSVSSLGVGSDQYTDVTLGNGFLVIDFRNNLKVTIEVIRINIFNTVPFQSLIGQLVFTNIPSGGHKMDSLNLAGVTLSSELGYSLPQFKSYASNSPVLVNLNDSISFEVITRNLKAVSGNAVFPNQAINAQDLNVDMVAEDTTVRIKTAQFESGVIDYSVTSTIHEQLQIKISIPGAMKNSLPFPPVNISVNNTTVTGQIIIDQVVFDLGQDISQPYNKIKVSVEPQVVSSNLIQPFDSSNYVDASFTFGTLKFKEVNGFMGLKEILIEPSEMALDFLDQFSSGLPLDDPKIKIISDNSIGVPVDVVLDVEGVSASGAKQKLNAPAFTIGYPTASQKGQTIHYEKEINKTNSQISQLLNLPPKKIVFGGKANLNAGGFKGTYNDFVSKGNAINVGYEMIMPLTLKTNNFTLQDTSDNPFFDIDTASGTIGKFKFGEDTAMINYVELITKIENGIPFDAELYLYFADKNGIIYSDSASSKTLLKSAIPLTGSSTTPSLSMASFMFTRDMIRHMMEKNLTKMIFKVIIKTYNDGAQAVNIYSTYKVKIGLSAKAKLKIALKK